MQNEPIMLLSDWHGQYIPQEFAKEYGEQCKGIDWADMQCLLTGPDHPYYWDTWDSIEQNAILVAKDGTEYTLYLNNDLWAIPKGMEIPEELIW